MGILQSIKHKLGMMLLKGVETGASNISDSMDNQAYRGVIPDALLVASNTSWVYAAVQRNANNIAMTPLRLFAKKSKSSQKWNSVEFKMCDIPDDRIAYLKSKRSTEKYFRTLDSHNKLVTTDDAIREITEHPLLTLLNTMNPFMNSFDSMSHLDQSMELTGNAYWQKDRDGTGLTDTPQMLWPREPQHVGIIKSKTKMIERYEYGSGSDKVKIPVENMVHFKFPGLLVPFAGTGPLQAGFIAAKLSENMNGYEAAMFKNGGRPDMQLTYPKEISLTSDQIKRAQQNYRNAYRGTENTGKLYISDAGGELNPVSMTPKEMSYLNGRKWSREEILAVFGVPMAFVAIQEISRANAFEAKQIYAEQTIIPRLTLIEEKLNEQLTPDFDDNIFLAFDDPRPNDVNFRLKERTTNIKVKYSSINEEREKDGLEPAAWGKEPIEPKPIEIPPPVDGGQGTEDPEKSNKAIKAHLKSKQELPSLGRPSTNFIPDLFVEALEQYFKRMKLEVMAKATDEILKSVAGQRFKANADDIVSGLFDFQKWDRELQDAITPFERVALLEGGQRVFLQLAAQIETGRIFEPNHPKVHEALETRKGNIVNTNRVVQERIRKEISKGIEAGQGPRSIKVLMSDTFDSITKNQSLLIARTEMIWAFNEGAQQGYIQSGVVTRKIWDTAEDERVCQWCGPLDGTEVGLETTFFKKGDEFVGDQGRILPFEYEDIQHPPLHPQCRCSIIPVVSDV